jgi:nucleoside-diphosphate-sugar epimerase
LDGDLRDLEFARRAVGDSGALVHLASHPIAWPTGASSMADEDVVEYAARGTYVTLVAAAAAGVPRVVLASTLDVMEAYQPSWLVDEAWRPRPSTALEELAPYVAEVSARDLARSLPLSVVCLRLGRLVGDEAAQRGPADPRWLHLDDAVQAIRRALTYPLPEQRAPGPENWRVFHIPGGRQARFPLAAAAQPAFGYAPEHDFGGRPALPETRIAAMDEHGLLVPAHSVAGRRSEQVTVYGACGPLGSAARPWLEDSYTLRLTDVLPPEEATKRVASRFPNAPRPSPVAPPHEFWRVDVGNWGEVSAAAEGAGALVNCSVLRERLDSAFRVNTIGAYNVVRAAVAHGIKRVIHTGPQTLNLEHPAGYGSDFDLPADVPIRAGANIYFHSKLLGLEICRTFAENHGLEVAALLVSSFVDPQRARRRPDGLAVIPSTVAWSDAGLAIRCALDVPALPSPFEALRIVGDLPHGKYSNTAARRVLGWAPRESLAPLWQAPHQPTTA